jgi:hypothetical protein
MRRKRTSQGVGDAIKLAEPGLAVPQVIAHQLARAALSGPTLHACDQHKFSGMVIEKQVALA